MPGRPPPDIGLAHRADRQCRHHPHRHLQLFQRVLHRQRIHHRCQHAHVIASGAFHAGRRAGDTAKDIAATDDETDLDTASNNIFDFLGNAGDHFGVDAIGPLAHE